MIDEDRTLQLYGYTSDELKPKSHKPIVAVCEGCGEVRILCRQTYRDFCHPCSHNLDGFKSKISAVNTGKKRTHECKKKMSRAHIGIHIGDKNPNWKGGVTHKRHRIYTSMVYKNWRAAVFKRDDYTCQMCNARGGTLEAHHIRPIKDHKNDLLIFDISNGATLCKDCHTSIRGREDEFITQFESIIKGE